MATVEYSAQARQDLRDLHRYYSEQATLRVADEIVDHVRHRLAKLADFPMLGRYAELKNRQDIRCLIVQYHACYYQVQKDKVVI